jgi:hypothetical protein
MKGGIEEHYGEGRASGPNGVVQHETPQKEPQI